MCERYIGDLETIHDDILSKSEVLVLYYNASEENDRATLLKCETYAKEKGVEIKPVDIYKSDKVMRILGGSPLALSLYKDGKLVASTSVKENFDLSAIEKSL